MGLAPNPQYPERAPQNYEEKIAGNLARRGPLRFEEGVATDTDVPSNFTTGVMQGYQTAPGRPNHNANVWEKWPEETMAARAHVGSASWVEAQTFLQEFAGGTGPGAEVRYEEVIRSGGRYERVNPASVND